MAMRIVWAGFFVLWLAAPLAAQQRRSTVGTAGPPVTVQLPTFHYFGVGTTVLVPDRGAVMMGGAGSSRAARSSFGGPLLPGSGRALGAQTSAGGVGISAWIHDFEALDQAVLDEAAARRRVVSESETAGLVMPKTLSASHSQSIAEIREQQAAAAAAVEQEASDLLAQGERAEAEGKIGAARIYYQMAQRRARGPLRERIAQRLALLRSTR